MAKNERRQRSPLAGLLVRPTDAFSAQIDDPGFIHPFSDMMFRGNATPKVFKRIEGFCYRHIWTNDLPEYWDFRMSMYDVLRPGPNSVLFDFYLRSEDGCWGALQVYATEAMVRRSQVRVIAYLWEGETLSIGRWRHIQTHETRHFHDLGQTLGLCVQQIRGHLTGLDVDPDRPLN